MICVRNGRSVRRRTLGIRSQLSLGVSIQRPISNSEKTGVNGALRSR
jgi:hypothetical protein